MLKQINVRLPVLLVEKGEELVRKRGYANIQDLIRCSLREEIDAFEQEEALRKLDSLRGIATGEPITKEEKERIAENMTEEKSNEMMKRYSGPLRGKGSSKDKRIH
ncbi:MAG: ribbon-helix-helix domain-containing protein [Nanoarchaeota archaeon]|nr:ribbon-helix-helix domain-containing protein [Nanoarchaeota archaeon]